MKLDIGVKDCMISKLKYSMSIQNNFVIFLIIAMSVFLSFIFLFCFQTEYTKINIQARLTGILLNVSCFLIIFLRWKKFTIKFRVLSVLCMIFASIILFQTINSLIFNLTYQPNIP